MALRFSIPLFPRTRRAVLRAVLVTGALLATLSGAAVWVLAMPGRSHRGALPPLSDEGRRLRDRLAGHVEQLAGRIGERNIDDHPRALEAAADYIRGELAALGFEVEEQPFDAAGRTVRNLVVELPGSKRRDEILVVGAHYDTNPGTPGADDNASGVAALIELAALLRERPLGRTVRLIALVNEEAPWFGTEAMGSVRAARRARERGEKIAGMISLESIGYYSDAPGSQQYPEPFDKLYPSEGNFLAFVGNVASRGFVTRAIGAFRRHAAFPSEGIAAPEAVPGVSLSDHMAWWAEGYDALMVTDTAPFRNPHYHEPTDTPAHVDAERLARVTLGMADTIAALCD